MDLFVGLSSYYTGSPGIELGDFQGLYTDSLGRQIEIEYNECTQVGALDQTDAHAGRGTVEYCAIDTSGLAGIEYTVVSETFSTPIDDGTLSFALLVAEGACTKVAAGAGVTECTLMGESPIEGSTDMEIAYCESSLAEFCCTHPDLCGEDPPEGFCDDLVEDGDIAKYCDAHPEACVDYCLENPSACVVE
jgi:hypothetical protein